MDKNQFWDVNYYHHPALTDEMIEKAEELLQVKLPADYLEFLKIQNGGYTKGFVFPMKQQTGRMGYQVPLWELYGIVIDESLETTQSILKTAYIIKEWELPEKQVLLSGGSYWWITLDYRESDNPVIRWLDREMGEDICLANSFGEFINGLVPEEIEQDEE